MFKVAIEINNEKVIADKKYAAETVYNAIDKMFGNYENITKESIGIYTATGK